MVFSGFGQISLLKLNHFMQGLNYGLEHTSEESFVPEFNVSSSKDLCIFLECV